MESHTFKAYLAKPKTEEKGTKEDEMAGWHHGLDGRESERTLGVGDGPQAWHAVIHGVAKSRT